MKKNKFLVPLNRNWKKLLLTMKLCLLFLLISAATLMANNGYSQNTALSIHLKNATLRDLISEVERQSEFIFVFYDQAVDLDRKIDVQVENQTIDKVLDEVLKSSELTYRIFDRQIGLGKRNSVTGDIEVPTSIDKLMPPDKRIISGTVKDSKGLVLPGVTVLAKGTTLGTITDANGQFKLAVLVDVKSFVFSFVGMKSQEVLLENKTKLSIVLEDEAIGIEEIVVIGYGTSRKKDLTGAVSIVKMDDIEKAPVASFAEALAGRVAGVQVNSMDGQPGNEMDIVIRGANSLTQSNSPLFVIDGFPVEDPSLGILNPEDIESITILKDASSTAIYGSRGANGVVVIETKKGRSGKPVITFKNQIGSQQLLKKMELMSPYEFVKYQFELNPVNAASVYFKNGRNLESYKDIKAVDLQDQLYRTALYRNHSLAVRGESGSTNYSLSGSVNKQEGIILNSGYDRYQGRISIDQILSPKLKAGIIVNYSKINYFGQKIASEPGFFGNSIMARAWAWRPVSGEEDEYELLDEEYDGLALNSTDLRLNPVMTIKNEHIVTQSVNMLGNAYLQYYISKDLTAKVAVAANNTRIKAEQFYNSHTTQGNLLNPFNSQGVWGALDFTDNDVWSNENTLTYKRAFNKDHKLTMLGGFSQQEAKTSLYGHKAQQVPNEQLGIAGLDEGIPLSVRAYESRNTLQSFFGRLDYNYKSKYLITGSIRADGSSKFAAANRWAYFPAAALRWNMQEEPFMKSIGGISKSTIRLSYGISGNNRVSDFGYLSALSLPLNNSYSFNNQTPTKGVVPGNLGNNDLKWESTASTDIGYELGLFNSRIELAVDLYRKTTRDLLLNANLPAQTGFTNAFKNIGAIRNDGLEISLNTINVRSKNFNWESNLNISFNQNKIIELTSGQQNLFSTVSFATGYNDPLYVAQIGQPAGMMYGYIFDGVYQYIDFECPSPGKYVLKNNIPTNGDTRTTIQPGDIKYKDLNGDGVVNTYDQTIIGRGQPIHTGGFVNNFRYKGFNLNVFLQWSYGNDIYNANRMKFEGYNLTGVILGNYNQFASFNDRWTPDHPSNKNYRVGGGGPLGMYSSRVVEDGSFLRLKTLSFGYSIPVKYIKRFYLSQLNFNVEAQNLLTFTKYTGPDPDVSARTPAVLVPGFDSYTYKFTKPGVYKVYFIAANANINESREVIRQIDITIEP